METILQISEHGALQWSKFMWASNFLRVPFIYCLFRKCRMLTFPTLLNMVLIVVLEISHVISISAGVHVT